MARKDSRTVPTAAAIRALAAPEIVARGEAYRAQGAVANLTLRGDRLEAEVAGSDVEPYRVGIRLDGRRIAETACSCPYEWGDCCKHVIATLLAYADDPEAAAERPTLAALLAPLDRAALAALILRRAEADPDLTGWIEAERATAVRPGGAEAVDPAPVMARARALLGERRQRRDYWDDYRPHGSGEALQALAARAVPFLEAGDGRNALRILEAVAEPMVADWVDAGYGDDEDTYLLFHDLGRMMAEAALSVDLPAAERAALAGTLEDWDADLYEHGVEEGFAVAALALRTGWDDPALAAVIAGGPGPWPADEADDFAELELTEIRLRVLDAFGRHEAYLNLARAAGAEARVAIMLTRLGRVAEAEAHAAQTFEAPSQSLALAGALLAAGKRAAALRVAEAGLALVRPRGPNGAPVAPLACWLREEATGDLARRAARAAFAESLSLADFEAARRIAGRDWPALRGDLLALLTEAERAPDRAEILLGEGMVAEAVACLGAQPGYETRDSVLLTLMDAAHASHPDWVIGIAERRAAPIMEEGRAGSYDAAAAWLRRAANAYDAAGRIDDWSLRIEALIERHRRKHKLRPLLEALRFDG